MALKTKITAAEFEALADALKEHYKEVNGSYLLDSDDAAELRTAAAKAREERDEANRQLAELNEQRAAADKARQEAEAEAARKKGDVAAIEASWKAKVDEATAAGNQRVARLETVLTGLLVDNAAIALANEISTAPELLLPHIQKRLKAEYDGDKGTTRVLDAEGKPSAMTIEDLSAELIANPKYAAIIKGSDARGGGAGGVHTGGGATGKKFNEMTQAERLELHAKVGSAEYRRIAQAAGVNIAT